MNPIQLMIRRPGAPVKLQPRDAGEKDQTAREPR